MSAEVLMADVRGRMRSFLELGLFHDPELLGRELRSLRTCISRTLAALAAEGVDIGEHRAAIVDDGRAGNGLGVADAGTGGGVEDLIV